MHPATPQPDCPGSWQDRTGAAPRQLRVEAAQLGAVEHSRQQTAPAPQQFCQASEAQGTMDDSGARLRVRALRNPTVPQTQHIMDTYIFDNSDLKKETSQQERKDFEAKCKTISDFQWWNYDTNSYQKW